MKIAEKLPDAEIEALFGTEETGWVPTSVGGLVEGIESVSMHNVPLPKLVEIYKILGLNHEPTDWVDRVRVGLAGQ